MGDIPDQSFRLAYSPTDVQGECVLTEVMTAKRNILKFVLFVIVSILTVGIPLLLVHWFPKLRRILYFDFVPFEQATHVAIINYDEELTICQIFVEQIYFDEISSKKCQYFINRYMKYVIDQNRVVRTQLFDTKARLSRITTTQQIGLNARQINQLRRCYGKGTMEIQQPTWYIILLKELIRPLYLFLFYSVSLWYYELYYIYATIVLATTIIAIAITVYQLKALNNKIFQMAYYEVKLQALRDGSVIEVSSIDLVPGDIVFLKDPIKLPFEGIILEGSALINQCALTGQSVPIVKKADVRDHYTNLQQTIDKAAYVFEGTTIIQVNSKKKMAQFQSTRQAFGIPVCVTRTNFLTLKGQLIRIILFPKEQQNVFQKQSAKFIACLFLIAVVTYFGMIPHLMQVVDPVDMVVKFLDLIAITVPPALPVSMAFGVIYAIEKLNDKSIFCIEENKVITGGAVNFSCFDKTGTLTQDFMDFQALIPAEKGKFYETINNRNENKFNIAAVIQSKPYLLDIYNNMASNHSIIRIETTGEMIGDPMEIKLFEFGQFTLNQSNSDPEVIFSFESQRGQKGEIFRRFQFDSDLQRMSVIVRVGANGLYSYCKGSPEMMMTIMDKSSIPSNYNQVLKEYTSNGFRVLAIGSKRIQGNDYRNVSREMAESGLVFNGFQVFENKLKPETKGAIKQLKQAKIGVVMITGDNPLTGSNIGYKCGISHREKGMIICDFRQGKFQEEKFFYNQRQVDQSSFINLRPQIGSSSLIDTDFGSKNKIANMDVITKAGTFEKIQEIQLQSVGISDSQSYMRNIIEKAKNTNSQLCVTGNAFNKLFEGKVQEISELKKQFLDCTTVFARTKPNDKAKIVMVYQHTGRTVSMCGDGANDCGALKQADIGLSLSQAEASISAPFTSQIANISSMVELIKQCRAGLATNFSLFNIMASYSLTQYTTSIIQELFFSYPADLNYLYWDIFCNFSFILFIGNTGTAEKLSIAKPNNSLFCLTNLFQVLFAFALNVIGQIGMILSLSGAFYDTVDYGNNGGFDVDKASYVANQSFSQSTPQTNILFMYVNFMYLATMLSFNIGQPWKKPFYTNIIFMCVFVVIFGYSIVIVMVPGGRIGNFLIAFMDDTTYNGFVLGVAFGIGLTIFLLQKFAWQPLSIWLKEKYPEKTWL